MSRRALLNTLRLKSCAVKQYGVAADDAWVERGLGGQSNQEAGKSERSLHEAQVAQSSISDSNARDGKVFEMRELKSCFRLRDDA